MVRLARILAFLAFLASLAALPMRAHASPSIEWNAPRECPDEEQVLSQVERLLGKAVDRHVFAELSTAAKLSFGPDGAWQLDLAMTTPEGRRVRTVKGESCAQVTDAAVIKIGRASCRERG